MEKFIIILLPVHQLTQLVIAPCSGGVSLHSTILFSLAQVLLGTGPCIPALPAHGSRFPFALSNLPFYQNFPAAAVGVRW